MRVKKPKGSPHLPAAEGRPPNSPLANPPKVCYDALNNTGNTTGRSPYGPNRNSNNRNTPGAGPDGGSHGRGVPPPVPGAGRRPDLHRNGQRQGSMLPGQKNQAPALPGGGRAPCRRANFRQRPCLHAGGGRPGP